MWFQYHYDALACMKLVTMQAHREDLYWDALLKRSVDDSMHHPSIIVPSWSHQTGKVWISDQWIVFLVPPYKPLLSSKTFFNNPVIYTRSCSPCMPWSVFLPPKLWNHWLHCPSQQKWVRISVGTMTFVTGRSRRVSQDDRAFSPGQ